MHTNLFPETLFQLVRKTWKQPCTVPRMAALKTFDNCLPWDSPANPCKNWLNLREKERFSSFRYPKRQREWLAGRICAKAAIFDYCLTHTQHKHDLSWSQIHIENLESGRPVILHGETQSLLREPDISISHSKDFALAFAAKTYCGIDIQHTTDRLFRVKDRFCSEKEEQLLQSIVDKEMPTMHLTLLWAAKEAAKKAVSISSMPGFLDMNLVKLEERTHGMVFVFSYPESSATPSTLKVIVGQYRDYGIGICLH